MITHSNSFLGALGNIRNIGGSRAFTTPNTIKVEPAYSLDIDYNIKGELIAHSLDGRLWFYKRGRRLGIIALKWNSNTARLEYATAKNISNNDDVILACGIDWILSNNNIFMVSVYEPYIISSSLFEDDGKDNFLYSILRQSSMKETSSDPFTNQVWGKRSDNGNSEGNGFFSKNTHLLYPAGTHTFEQCYSNLPAIGDWQIFENFLIRRPDADSLNSYNSMLSLRPLIPFEARYGSTPAYGTGYNLDHRGIQLACQYGQLWGRGLYNIGRVCILPTVFGDNDEVLEYYLYIAPDFPCSPFLSSAPDINDEWLNMAIIPRSTDNTYGFLTQQTDALSNRTCIQAPQAKLFLPDSNEWLDLSDYNGVLFADNLNSSALVLHDKGAIFFNEDIIRADCTTLPQWLAPAGHVQTVSREYVIGEADNSMFYTSLNNALCRQALSKETMPPSPNTFQDNEGYSYKLILHEETNTDNKKSFDCFSLVYPETITKSLNWLDVYKNVKIRMCNTKNFWDPPFLAGIHINTFYDPLGVQHSIPVLIDEIEHYYSHTSSYSFMDPWYGNFFNIHPGTEDHIVHFNTAAVGHGMYFNLHDNAWLVTDFGEVTLDHQTQNFTLTDARGETKNYELVTYMEEATSILLIDGKIAFRVEQTNISYTSSPGYLYISENTTSTIKYANVTYANSYIHDDFYQWEAFSDEDTTNINLILDGFYIGDNFLSEANDTFPEFAFSCNIRASFLETYTGIRFFMELPSLLAYDSNSRKSGLFVYYLNSAQLLKTFNYYDKLSKVIVSIFYISQYLTSKPLGEFTASFFIQNYLEIYSIALKGARFLELHLP